MRSISAITADPEALLRDADTAMYHAKELGKARCATFDESMRERATERLELEGGLRHALRRGELRLLYQPQVDMSTGCIVGAEALIRWHHPERGVLGPAAFVPIAEQTGMIVPIGAWVVEQACRQAAEWARTVDRPFTVCVNVSARQLSEGDFTATVGDALAVSDLDPALLCLEITESAVLADPDAATEALERLKALGVRLAIDDFGIGYSSLSQLKALLPVDTIKIDKSFVDGVTADGEDSAIVAAVLRLAAGLRLSAIAEGVETPEQVEALLELGCRSLPGLPLRPPADVRRPRSPAHDRGARRAHRRSLTSPAASAAVPPSGSVTSRAPASSIPAPVPSPASQRSGRPSRASRSRSATSAAARSSPRRRSSAASSSASVGSTSAGSRPSVPATAAASGGSERRVERHVDADAEDRPAGIGARLDEDAGDLATVDDDVVGPLHARAGAGDVGRPRARRAAAGGRRARAGSARRRSPCPAASPSCGPGARARRSARPR